jgi:hypothetical protein
VKKDNIEAVTKWRKDNVERRKAGLGDDDDNELDQLMSTEKDGKGGPSRKRKAADRKWGFGGVKNKKATRNDDKALNNLSDYNPKAMKSAAREFSGKGGKGGKGGGKGGKAKGGKGGGKGKGGNRPGKDSRTQGRQQRG